MDPIFSKISTLATQVLPDIIDVRRTIHANPELSFREEKTSAYIREQLLASGIDEIEKTAGTGLIARVRGSRGAGSRVVLRAELDALPIDEKSGLSFASRNKGVMHACGHDAHMAMLLGAARVINSIRDELTGDFWFLFQPGEELVPGGASLVIREGTLDRIEPHAIIAQHVLPEMKPGNTGFRAGRYMASSDEIYIKVTGRGGHAALPGATTDQVLIASRLLVELKERVSELAGEQPSVFAVGRFVAEGATNVIPESVSMEGTLRTFDERLRSEIHQLLEQICREHSSAEIAVDLEIRHGYPVLINDEELTETGIMTAAEVNGKETVEALKMRMSSEDFAFYSQRYPVLFYRLGVATGNPADGNLHSPAFNLYEPAMETGIRTICSIAYRISSTLPPEVSRF